MPGRHRGVDRRFQQRNENLERKVVEMSSLVGLTIFLVFIVIAVLMSRDLMPTAIALPVMAVVISAVGGASMKDILTTVITNGSAGLATSMIIVIFSVWLGQVLVKTGIAENIIRKSAEYAGDRPLLLAILVTAASAFILTSIRGLGAFILVGTIALPILLSVGISGLTAACLALLAYSIGNLLNLGTWAVFEGIFKQKVDTIASYVFGLAGILAAATLLFIIISLRKGTVKRMADQTPALRPYEEVPLISFLSPAVPLVFVMGFKWDIIPAILVGTIFALVTTGMKRSIRETFNILQSAMFDGFKDAAPAGTLLIGLGMLLAAIKLPAVATHLDPVFNTIIPTGTLGYIVVFVLAVPFVLYRGPFNLWGMGAGLVTLIMKTGHFGPQAVMAAFMAGAAIQQAIEPTNTHNIWTASYTDTTVTAILRKLLLWLWAVASLGVILGAIMYV
jgi:hypothetical protein